MIGALINLIIWMLVIGILYWLAVFVADNVIPEPPRAIVKVVLIVVIAIVVILLLLNLLGIGTGDFKMPRINVQ